jgi:hypothetical protein
MSMEDWKKRYIDTLLNLGVSPAVADVFYNSNKEDVRGEMSAEWQARELYNCKIAR